MSDQEYERRYREALAQLRAAGSEVGEPYVKKAGRFCEIDGLPCSDELVFQFASSNDSLVEQIRKGVEAASAVPASCPTCDDLLRQYDRATEEYVKLIEQRGLHGVSPSELEQKIEAAAELYEGALLSFLEHQNKVHGTAATRPVPLV